MRRRLMVKIEFELSYLDFVYLFRRDRAELSLNHFDNSGFQRLAVIAAVGTRRYYRSRGFHDQGRYLVKD